jgi:hypothetical protein
VHFTALGLAARISAIFWPGGDDPTIDHAVGHQLSRVLPDRLECLQIDPAASLKRAQPGAIQQLGAIDIADPGDHRLIHKKKTDGSFACCDSGKCRVWIGVLLKGIRSESRHQLVPFLPIVNGTVGRTTKLEPIRRGRDSQPQCALRLSQRHLPFREITESTEMHMQDQVAAEVVAQVFAVGDDAAQFTSIEEFRVRKLTRGRVRAHSATDKDRCLPVAKSMNFISLGHPFLVTSPVADHD